MFSLSMCVSSLIGALLSAGTKFAANSWIHLYDYAKPNLWGCTGSFDEL